MAPLALQLVTVSVGLINDTETGAFVSEAVLFCLPGNEDKSMTARELRTI